MNRYLKYVLIISGFNIITSLLIYFINKPLVVSFKFSFVQFFFLVTVLLIGMFRQREKIGTALDYGERFKFCFSVGFISNLPSFLLFLVIYKLDAAYRMLAYKQQFEIAGAFRKATSKIFGNLDRYQIEEQTVDLMIMVGDFENYNLYSGSEIFSSIFNYLLLYLIFSLLISLFIYSEKISLKERWRRIDL